ncbi:hypothetical protein M5K25_028053 [Dendrobium thyrsiflorum]|uniref:Uncharacterized protein n=1 Tax=Dendrobium thyrsiflorum TaxID=117978 RepID=A0ABD0TVB3_DENTH
MADSEVDHGFVEDSQGRTDILRLPFFDLRLDHDQSVEDYVDRILYQLTLLIEEHIHSGRWQIVGRPPTPPTSATSPTTKIICFFFLVVTISLVRKQIYLFVAWYKSRHGDPEVLGN